MIMMKDKYYELKSWSKTVVADLITEFALGMLTGIQTLLATGDFSKASIVAIGSAVLTATVRSGLKKLLAFLDNGKSK